MSASVTTADLEAYLDEALAPDEMARIEMAMRESPELLEQLATLSERRDAGVHSLGDIWRRSRLSCPPRQELGSYLMGIVAGAPAAYIKFHLEEVGCRFCAANAADLRQQQAESEEHVASRRRKYFQSSAGHLRSET